MVVAHAFKKRCVGLGHEGFALGIGESGRLSCLVGCGRIGTGCQGDQTDNQQTLCDPHLAARILL